MSAAKNNCVELSTSLCIPAECPWQIAIARASAASSGLGTLSSFSICRVISITCCFSALPYPTTACFTCRGVYSNSGTPRLEHSRSSTPRACATLITVFLFVVKNSSSTAAQSGLYLSMSIARSSDISSSRVLVGSPAAVFITPYCITQNLLLL